MLNIFKKNKKDFLKIGIKYFRENQDLTKIYLSINEFSENIRYGEVIRSEDLKYFINNEKFQFNHKNWLFLLTFDLKDNNDIDNLYRFEELKIYESFTEIYAGKFAMEINPIDSDDTLTNKIRNILSKVYLFNLKKNYGVLSGVWDYTKFPDLLNKSEDIKMFKFFDIKS